MTLTGMAMMDLCSADVEKVHLYERPLSLDVGAVRDESS